jgi:hypothetical protein
MQRVSGKLAEFNDVRIAPATRAWLLSGNFRHAPSPPCWWHVKPYGRRDCHYHGKTRSNYACLLASFSVWNYGLLQFSFREPWKWPSHVLQRINLIVNWRRVVKALSGYISTFWGYIKSLSLERPGILFILFWGRENQKIQRECQYNRFGATLARSSWYPLLISSNSFLCCFCIVFI